MKKAIDITLKILITFSTLNIISCTLDMEDWVPTEEEKGYGEVATMEYDGMKCEYEFKDETLHLTDNILDYLISTDGDTTFYFMDNIPEEYRPKEGGYIASFCCDELPMGVNAQVVSVGHTNGMYVVETKPVGLEETYKEFKLDLDMDLRFARPEDSTASAKQTRAMKHKKRAMKPSKDKDMNCIVDWTTYDYMVSGGKQTRADGFDYEEDETVDESTTLETQIFKIDFESSEFIKAFRKDAEASKWLSLLPKITAGASSLQTVHIKKIIDVSKKREYTKITSTKGYHIYVSCGSSFDAAQFLNKNNGIGQKIKDIINKKIKEQDMDKDAFVDGAFVMSAPIGPVPCVARIKPDLSFTVALIGNIENNIYSSTVVTETDIVDGKVVKDETRQLDTPPTKTSINAVGEVALTGGIEFFVGVGTAAPPNKVIGIGAFATIQAEVKFAYSATIAGDNELANNKDGISLSMSLAVGPKAIAGKYVDLSFAAFKVDLWQATPLQYYPTIKDDIDYSIFHGTDENGEKYRELKYSYKISKLGTHFSEWYSTHIPCLIVQKGIVAEIVYPDGGKPKKTAIGTYSFTYRTFDQTNSLNVYPCLRYTKDDMRNDIVYIQNQRVIPAYACPKVKYILKEETNLFSTNTNQHVYQTKGTWAMKSGGNTFSYSIDLPFELKNAGCIPDCWDDWGLYYVVKVTKPDGSTESLGAKYFSMKDKIKKSGTYEIEKSFSYTANGFAPMTEVEAIIYYVKRGETVKRYLEGPDSKEYQDIYVSYQEKENYRLINHYYEMDNNFKSKNRPSWYHKYKTIK